MNVRIQADAVAVGRALVAALLFVGERAASFSEAKFDDTVFGSVLKRRRTHWTNRNWPEQFVEPVRRASCKKILSGFRLTLIYLPLFLENTQLTKAAHPILCVPGANNFPVSELVDVHNLNVDAAIL